VLAGWPRTPLAGEVFDGELEWWMQELQVGNQRGEQLGPTPTTSDELLHHLSARALLDRMPAPVIGLDHDGAVVYANDAASAMLGFGDVATLLRHSLPLLLSKDSASGSSQDCMATLLDAGEAIIEWSHTEGFPVRTTVSTVLLRASDPVILIYINDVTELLWAEVSRRRRA